jgi:hypothetical protein
VYVYISYDVNMNMPSVLLDVRTEFLNSMLICKNFALKIVPFHSDGILLLSYYVTYVKINPLPTTTGCLERELQIVQLSATRCSCIAIL